MLQPFHSMNSALSSALQRGKAFLTPSTSSDSLLQPENGRPGSKKAPEGALFPKVDPRVDGEDCDRDCGSCTIQYPAKWKIDENQHLYGHVHAWATHILVATGKTDWVRDVEDEKGSVMEAVEKYGKNPSNGVCFHCRPIDTAMLISCSRSSCYPHRICPYLRTTKIPLHPHPQQSCSCRPSPSSRM